MLSYARPDSTQFALSGRIQQTSTCIIEVQAGISFCCFGFYLSNKVPKAIKYTLAYGGQSPIFI